jgi:hypothetical protein
MPAGTAEKRLATVTDVAWSPCGHYLAYIGQQALPPTDNARIRAGGREPMRDAPIGPLEYALCVASPNANVDMDMD